MLNNIFSSAVIIVERLEANGYQAFFVGGSVRDYLLKKPIKDIDIATSATPSEVQAIFPKVIPVGIEHGTVIVRHMKESFEVTTFRTEGEYSDFRHPDEVKFVNKIEDDLSRRDFTINAIAMDKSGTLYDPFYGQNDIKKQLISTVGNASDRFLEDPLRMMRALRFVSQLGFSLEKKTLESIKEKIEWIEEIAVERLAIEFEKTVAGQAMPDAIRLFSCVNIWIFLPAFHNNPGLIKSMEKLPVALPYLYEVFAYLKMQEPQLSLRELVRDWKQSNQTFMLADKLVYVLDLYKCNGLSNWLLYQLPVELYEAFVRLTTLLYCAKITELQLIEFTAGLPVQSRKDIAISGDDLIVLYPDRKKGDWIATYLTEIERAILAERLANKADKIKEWVIECHPPKNN